MSVPIKVWLSDYRRYLMKERNNDNIEKVMNYCLQDEFDLADVEDRRLYLNSEVDEKVIDSLAYMIMEFNRKDEGLPVEKRKPIRLYINSPGGSVYDGFGLCSAIKTSTTPVYTINQALCASMGFISLAKSVLVCHILFSFFMKAKSLTTEIHLRLVTESNSRKTNLER